MFIGGGGGGISFVVSSLMLLLLLKNVSQVEGVFLKCECGSAVVVIGSGVSIDDGKCVCLYNECDWGKVCV